MKTLKIIAVLVSLTFLMSSCYTQLAVVKHETPQQEVYSDNDNGAYYYPPSSSDTLYQDESPEIVQNFYYNPPYYDPYDFSLNIGFYNNWWWDDFYYTSWPFIGYRPLRPIVLFPIIGYWGYYDPFYWNIYNPYYDPWYYSGPAYSSHYGPRPFVKGGSLVRGDGSRRVRISHLRGTTIGGSSTFLPTRAVGSSNATKRRSVAIRKRSSETPYGGTYRSSGQSRVLRKGNPMPTTRKPVIIKRRGNSTRTVIDKRSATTRKRRYFPITVNRKTVRRQPAINHTQPRREARLKTPTHRRTTHYRNSGTYESHRWTPPSRSSSTHSGYTRPSYSAPSRSTSVRSSSVRSGSTRSSTRSSGTPRAVRRK